MPEKTKYKYCGCVTDIEFKRAVMELYPNRKFNHPDQFKRKAMMNEKTDLPEYAKAMQAREHLRYFEERPNV